MLPPLDHGDQYLTVFLRLFLAFRLSRFRVVKRRFLHLADDEQAPDALLLADEQHGFKLKPSLAAGFLVQELVAVVRLGPRDFPGPGDLEPLDR